MNSRDGDAVLGFIERFASALADSGMPRMPSRVFVALLAADDGRLTAAELAEQLHVSPAAVSGGLRYLTQLGMASRERQPGSRRDRYRVRDDTWYDLMLHREQLLARWIASAQEGVRVLGADTPAGARFADTVEFFEFLQGELGGLLGRWHAHRAEETG